MPGEALLLRYGLRIETAPVYAGAMQTSGLTLDVYDDFDGATLRALYPSLGDIPDGVKQAHRIAPSERDGLPDDVFALVMLNNGEKLRKYACIDEGNTVLSVQYFLKNAHKLPQEAQKTAAENLIVASSWYDLEVPEELRKLAFGLGTAMSAMSALPVIKGTHQAIKDNMAATKHLEAQGAGVVTPSMRNAVLGKMAGSPASALLLALEEMKLAELTGTPAMPSQPMGDPKVAPTKAVIAKTASGGMGHLVPGHKGEHGSFGPIETEAYNGYTKGKAPERLPQAGNLRPTVDVSAREASKSVGEKMASNFAVPSQNKYPLDSYDQVKRASAYFDEYRGHMSPPMRREFASNLVMRADALTIPVSEEARKYGSAGFAPEHEIKAAFDARRIELGEQEEALALLAQVEKVARFRMWKDENGEKLAQVESPDFVVELLAEFDKVAGLNHRYDRGVPDPFYSIFGFEKRAEDDARWSDLIGNAYVTASDLKRLAKVGAQTLKHTFGEDFQKEFIKDPIAIYSSLPIDQKKMLINMAVGTQPGNEVVY